MRRTERGHIEPRGGLACAARLINRKNVANRSPSASPSPSSPSSTRVKHHAQDPDEQVPHPRRPDRARGLGARPQGRARHRRPAAELPRRPRRLAGGAARLRALPLGAAPRARSTLPTLERIALAVAEHYHSEPGIALHAAHRPHGRASGIDEVALAREFDSDDEREAALLRYLKALVDERGRGRRCTSTRRRARPAGDDEQILEAIAFVTLESFTAMVNVAGEVPVDGSVEESRTLRAA